MFILMMDHVSQQAHLCFLIVSGQQRKNVDEATVYQALDTRSTCGWDKFIVGFGDFIGFVD